MSGASILQEAQIPLYRITALVSGHGVFRHAHGVGEILAVRVSQEGCQGAVALAVAETGIRVTVHARRAQGTDSLGRALTALVAEAAESEVGLHGIYCRRLALTQEEPDALLQLGFHSGSP